MPLEDVISCVDPSSHDASSPHVVDAVPDRVGAGIGENVKAGIMNS
jgi:hypothetical protein